MNKTLVFAFYVISISTGFCAAWGDGKTIPPKLEGDDLCRLGSFLTTEDKVAVSDIQVDDIQLVPLTTSSGNQLGGKPEASVVLIKRSLLGSGAHRVLETFITLELEVDESSQHAKQCDLIILEKLSNGVFADPFQLQRLKQQDAFKKVYIYGDVDLERPARTSHQSLVEIHTALVEKEEAVLGALDKNFRSKVSLPLHARYPPTTRDTYFQLNITMPQVMVKCKTREGLSTSHGQEICIHTFTNVPSDTLHWFIPTGRSLHSTVVDGVTTCAALLGVVSVFLASKKSGLMNNPKRT